MRRFLLTLSAGAICASAPLTARQDGPGYVYITYYDVNYGDLFKWTANYFEHSVPVLEALQSEGVINGWNVWQHSTGGEYNWRFAIQADEWGDFDQFWSEYQGRLQQRSPEAFAAGGGMLRGHRDEVWSLASVEVQPPADGQYDYLYDSRFQIGFDQLEAWEAEWNRIVVPVLEQARADGLLGGWVIENHNAGGPDNWKILYMFDEWDHMDDVFARLLGALGSDQAQWERIGSMIQSHDDVVWAAVVPLGN